MAEDQRQRFRRLVQTLADDDRTFLDSSLLGTYKNSLSLGLQKNWLSQSEYNNYLGVGDKRLKTLRGVQLMDAQGNKLTKSIDVQVPTPQGFVTQTKTTPITPLDLLRRTGGQMEGADVDAPTYTGFTLELVMTAILVLVILLMTQDKANKNAASAPIAIALTIFVLILITGPIEGTGINPARWFGPAIAGGYWDNWTIYVIAPLLGGALGAFSFRALAVHK